MSEVFKFLDEERLSAVRVQFKKGIFEEDFPERGMIAWLTSIKEDKDSDCFKLYFDFTDFEKQNLKYFNEVYYPNKFTKELGVDKPLYTAIEAGCYSAKYWVLFGDTSWTQEEFNVELSKYLKVIE